MGKSQLPKWDPQKAHQEKLRRIAARQEFDAVIQEFVRNMRRQMSFLERFSLFETIWTVSHGMVEFEIRKSGCWSLEELEPKGSHSWEGYTIRNNSFRQKNGQLVGYPTVTPYNLRRMLEAYKQQNNIVF